MNLKGYHNLISNRNRSFFGSFLYITLIVVSRIYLIIIRLRNYFYDKNIFSGHHVNAAVISIGNITAGGTGKTPIVAWICNEITKNPKFLDKNYKTAILTRGYKSNNKNVDEPAVLVENCPNTNVIINPDRVAGAAQAIGNYNANVLIMDDGFQHRRLARNIDIIAIDATCPFGYDRIIPAGLLREPINSLKRAKAAIITRCNQVSEAQLCEIEQKMRKINSNMIICRSIHQPVYIKTIDNRQISLESFKNKKVFAFCGIGNPDSFITSLKSMSYDVIGSDIFNDHYDYRDDCLAEINKQSQNLGAELILTTQKDWTKIHFQETAQNMPLGYVAIEIKFLSGEDKLRCLIEDTLQGKITCLIEN